MPSVGLIVVSIIFLIMGIITISHKRKWKITNDYSKFDWYGIYVIVVVSIIVLLWASITHILQCLA